MIDLIKREDALQALVDSDVRGHEYKQLDKAIKAIPSADRPQGEWIHDYHFGLALPEHKCSVCGEWEYSDTEKI